MTRHRSAPELLALQSLRLAGAADAERIADRSFLPADLIEDQLRAAQAAGQVEAVELGPSRFLVLTEPGRSRLRTLLADDLEAADARETLRAVLEDFEQGLNDEMVRAVSEWQRSAPSAPQDELLGTLVRLGSGLQDVLGPLVAELPRFGRYPAQYGIALRRAQDGELLWIAGVGILSCHTVWAELHQDLLSTLDRERTPEPRPEES